MPHEPSIWRTLDGSTAHKRSPDIFVFVTVSEHSHYNIGDVVPLDWTMVPHNQSAKDEVAFADEHRLDSSIAGKANCGCVHHAQGSIPCEHDIDLAFQNTRPE